MNRLFSIIQQLKVARQPVRAQDLAQTLEVSQRTIYRDIAELQMQGIPIEGEAGMGYVLHAHFEMPALMLTSEEIEAALLGAQWVSQCGDVSLQKGAKSLIEKIQASVPKHLQHVMMESPIVQTKSNPSVTDTIDMKQFRQAMGEQKKIRIHYQTEQHSTTRVIWPFMIAFFEYQRVIAAWCELRKDFRHFRSDRILAFEILDDTFPHSSEHLKQRWKAKGYDK